MSAYPAEVSIGANYRTDISPSVLPSDNSHIKIHTTFGEVTTNFSSWLPPAPGIEVSPMFTDSLIKTVEINKFNFNALIPSDAELQSAVTSAAEQLALRFGIGVVAAEAILLAGASLYRRDRPSARQIATGAVASALAFGTIAGQIALNYQPEHYSTFTVNGALASVYDSRGLLSDLSARSQQMDPFITSLLTISNEIQKKVVSPESDKPIAAKILLVSDIHGVDQYAMMRKIIVEQGITAVIDSGDLDNFGFAEEIDASGLAVGIESLGVPYIFTGGNHDSNSPNGNAVLTRLAQIKNVILLQPSPTTYTIANVDGITIAGLNDPLYYSSDPSTNDKRQAVATDLFNQTFADQPTPDIVVAHEPSAVEAIKIDGGVKINGHMHQAALNGNRIQVGSFTGGGLFHHTPNDSDGISTEPQYAFDVLTIDTSCGLQSLARFAFRSVLQGEPQYDSVAYINGAQIWPRPNDNRTCSPEQEVTHSTIAAKKDDQKAAPPVAVGPTTIPSYIYSPQATPSAK